MRLLGAKEFLETVKPGTLCIEFWMDDEKDCFNLIKDFEENSNVNELFKKYGGEFYFFGDNTGSLSFLYDYKEPDNIDGFEYDCLFYYDKNIVGDASPRTTLQLVYDSEEEWPDYITPDDYYHESINKTLNKEDLKRIQKWFLEVGKPFRDETNEDAWALNILKEEKNDKIINYRSDYKHVTQ